VKKQEFPNF